MIDTFLNFLDLIGLGINKSTLSLWLAPIYITIFLGLILKISLSFCNQAWASTYHNTMSFLMLPLIAFTITKVISGNIALALGMVGALSIVRFRHPVRNPFELVMYFALITIGITASVKLKYAVDLTLILVAIIFASWALEIILRKYKKNLYSYSFAEGQLYNNLEITLTEKKDDLSNSKFLLQEMHDLENNIYIYKFASLDSKIIKEKIKYVSDKYKKDIKNITADYI